MTQQEIKTIALVVFDSPISTVNLSIIPPSTKFFTRLLTADSDSFSFFPISTNDSLASFRKNSIIFSSILSLTISSFLLVCKQFI